MHVTLKMHPLVWPEAVNQADTDCNRRRQGWPAAAMRLGQQLTVRLGQYKTGFQAATTVLIGSGKAWD